MKGDSDRASVILRAAAAVVTARPSRWTGRRKSWATRALTASNLALIRSMRTSAMGHQPVLATGKRRAAGSLASLVGLAVSYAWDLPTGAAMVCVFGGALAAAGMLRPLRTRSRSRLKAAGAPLSIALALVLALSGLWLMIAPRADQPFIDGMEFIFPELRSAYMRDFELEAWRDVDEHAQRYAREIEKLNEREAQSRWQGVALDDMTVRKISSFLKSYGEMRKGEAFVMREVRSRARERMRWFAGIGLMLIGLVIMFWSKRWFRAAAPK